MFSDPFEPAYLVLELVGQKGVFFWFSKDKAMGMLFLLRALESAFYILHRVRVDLCFSLGQHTDVLNSTSLRYIDSVNNVLSNSLQTPNQDYLRDIQKAFRHLWQV